MTDHGNASMQPANNHASFSPVVAPASSVFCSSITDLTVSRYHTNRQAQPPAGPEGSYLSHIVRSLFHPFTGCNHHASRFRPACISSMPDPRMPRHKRLVYGDLISSRMIGLGVQVTRRPYRRRRSRTFNSIGECSTLSVRRPPSVVLTGW